MNKRYIESIESTTPSVHFYVNGGKFTAEKFRILCKKECKVIAGPYVSEQKSTLILRVEDAKMEVSVNAEENKKIFSLFQQNGPSTMTFSIENVLNSEPLIHGRLKFLMDRPALMNAPGRIWFFTLEPFEYKYCE